MYSSIIRFVVLFVIVWGLCIYLIHILKSLMFLTNQWTNNLSLFVIRVCKNKITSTWWVDQKRVICGKMRLHSFIFCYFTLFLCKTFFTPIQQYISMLVYQLHVSLDVHTHIEHIGFTLTWFQTFQHSYILIFWCSITVLSILFMTHILPSVL